MVDRVVLVDTNIVIEAVRSRTWNAISGGSHLVTVQECVEEALRGDTFSSGHVAISAADLGRIRDVHPVDDQQRAELLLRLPEVELDDGERDLYAHGLSRTEPPAWVLASPDRAAVRAAVELGWGDRLVSLEDLLVGVGCERKLVGGLREHFRSGWLSRVRAQEILRLL